MTDGRSVNNNNEAGFGRVLSELAEPQKQILQYLGGRIVPSDVNFTPVRFTKISDNCFSEFRCELFNDPAEPGSIAVDALMLSGALTTRQGFVVHNGMLVLNNQFASTDWIYGRTGTLSGVRFLIEQNGIYNVNHFSGTALLTGLESAEAVANPCFLFDTNFSSRNFGHLVHDTVVQIPTYLKAVAMYGPLTPVCVGRGFAYEPMRQIVYRLTGVPLDQWLFTNDKSFKFRKLFVPVKHVDYDCWKISFAAVQRLKDLISSTFGHSASKRDIYVSRTGSTRLSKSEPVIENIGDLSGLLCDLGFLHVEAANLPLEDYFDIFGSGNIFIGVHGAGLMNIVLAEHPKLIELTFAGYPDWRSIEQFAKGMRAPYRRLHVDPIGGPIRIDLAAVKGTVEAIRAL